MTAYYYRAAHKQTDLYLDNQMHQLLAHAAQSGTDTYLLFADNGYSGLNLDRPAMTQMQMAMAQGLIGKIVVKDISRLARDTAAFLTFAEDADRLLVELETVNGENLLEVLNETRTLYTALEAAYAAGKGGERR
mgnify:FL=1